LKSSVPNKNAVARQKSTILAPQNFLTSEKNFGLSTLLAKKL